VHDLRLDGIDVCREVADEVVLGQPAETLLVDDEVRKRWRGRCVAPQGGDRLASSSPNPAR
jgi:hypothetical protein